MFEIRGKYSTAKVFADKIDEDSVRQIYDLCNQQFTENERIRMMPDVHAGAGCVIGTTMTVTDRVVPNLVGVDIGCGMETVLIKGRQLEPEQLDKFIKFNIPSGFSIRNKEHRYAGKLRLSELRCAKHISLDRAFLSLGTLGGGNHFIEADKGESGIYIVIHSGSRHLGVEVAKHYQKRAVDELKHSGDADVKKLIAEMKSAGREKEINAALKKLNMQAKKTVPDHLAYVFGSAFDDYIHDMKIVQEFAMLNRKAMMDDIIRSMKLKVTDEFTTVHNYIDTENMIVRKGSVSAQKGERLIIPINMRDGSLICIGKGNPDWNFSAPHGAGRLFSRSQAKQSFTVSEFKKQMVGIYSSTINSATLDECPMAYKSMNDIVDNIGDTVDIIEVIKPIYNYKAGEENGR